MTYAKKRRLDDGRVRYTGVYLDGQSRERSAGTFTSKRAAEHAAQTASQAIEQGNWIDPTNGRIKFRDYVEQHWWPSRHLEPTTKASYRSYLDRHFLPFFGDMPMRGILPSTVQAWVTQATASGLSPRSVIKYHVMLHGLFRRAVRDQVLLHNPASETELPKAPPRRLRILTPDEFDRLLSALPRRFMPMVMTDIETGLRWGELIALRPSDIDFLRRAMTIQRVVLEVSKKITGAEARTLFRDYPKDNEARTLRISSDLTETLSQHIASFQIGGGSLLFPSSAESDSPISRNTFRTRVWLPAIERAGLDFHVRFHDLRHAHASWALAGGADLKAVMDRMGHSQISTTQRYLHSLPDSDDKALAAFARIRNGGP